MPLSAGTRVGEYIIARFIGAGGFGEVYEARAVHTQHRVALKLLYGTSAHTAGEKFKQEALFTNRVREQSRFVPMVVAAGIDAHTSRPWLAVEFIEGLTLDVLTELRQRRGQRWSWNEAKEILFCVMDALSAAHANNIVHCDIKPENIIVQRSPTPERTWIAYVLDFGIAKVRSDYAPRSMTTRAMSLHWASPEQLDGRAITPKSDQWSFAQVVYWMLVGAQFPLTESQRTTPVQWARSLGVLLPPEFETWFAKATRNAPQERFESIEQAWNALERTFSSAPAAPHEIAQPAHLSAASGQDSMAPVPVSGSAKKANARHSVAASSTKRIGVLAALLGVLAITGVTAQILSQLEKQAPQRTPQGSSEPQTTSPSTPRPPTTSTFSTGYVPIAQRPDVLEAARRWKAFVESYGATPVEQVYLPHVRFRTGRPDLTREQVQRWWAEWPSGNATFTVDLSSAMVIERPANVRIDGFQCQGYPSLIEMRVSVREYKPMLSERVLRQMPCPDLRGTYTVRFVRSNGMLLVCHENWRNEDFRAACPNAL